MRRARLVRVGSVLALVGLLTACSSSGTTSGTAASRSSAPQTTAGSSSGASSPSSAGATTTGSPSQTDAPIGGPSSTGSTGSSAGGTSASPGQAVVVLAPERPVSDAVMDQLVKLLRVRTVRIRGETSIDVTAAGGQVTLTGGADQAAAMRALVNPGTLLLRPVLATKTPLPAPVNDSEKRAEDAFGTLNCDWGDPTRPLAAAGDYIAACAQSAGNNVGNDKYLLGPAKLSDKDVKDVQVSQSNGSWGVDISLNAAGTNGMADLSAAAAAGQQADGTNSIAVVLDDVVYEAPTVSSAITDGQLRLSTANENFAKQDAAVWSLGTMPLRLVSSTVAGG